MADHHGILTVSLLLVIAVTVKAQCDLPTAWTSVTSWWAGYTTDQNAAVVNKLYSFNVSYHNMYEDSSSPALAPDISKCENNETFVDEEDSTITYETIAGLVRIGTSPANRFCFEGILRGHAMLYRHTVDEQTDTAKTVENCLDDFGDTANKYNALVQYPFTFTSQSSTVNQALNDGEYMFSYTNGGGTVGCTSDTSKMTVSGNELILTTCFTGAVTYETPLNGKLNIVGVFTNEELLLESDAVYGGMMMLAYPDSAATLGYYFYVARYSIKQVARDQPESLEIMLTTDNKNSPVGYTSAEFISASIDEKYKLVFSISTNECAAGPCNNGGTCVQKFSYAECLCPTGFSGDDCSDDYDDCANTVDPCSGHGTCKDKLNEYECDCDQGYGGEKCDVMDPCWNSPCGSGTCVKISNTNFTCTCPDNYFGRFCEFYDWCGTSNPCQNGASCFLTRGNDYRCMCKPGWAGRNCDQPFTGTTTNRPPPGPVVCENNDDCNNGGTCEERRCQCQGYWIGPTCDVMSLWFIVSIALIVFLVILLIIVLLVCCCCCMDRGQNAGYQDNEYATMKSQSGIMPIPGTVSFNVLSSPNRTYSN